MLVHNLCADVLVCQTKTVTDTDCLNGEQCRNANGEKSTVWCSTSNTAWEYCDPVKPATYGWKQVSSWSSAAEQTAMYLMANAMCDAGGAPLGGNNHK